MTASLTKETLPGKMNLMHKTGNKFLCHNHDNCIICSKWDFSIHEVKLITCGSKLVYNMNKRTSDYRKGKKRRTEGNFLAEILDVYMDLLSGVKDQ